MKMTPAKLVLLRLYGMSLGRTGLGAQVLRGAITRRLITTRVDAPYVASSRYFDPVELGPPERATVYSRPA